MPVVVVDTEVAQDQRRDVAERPLLARFLDSRLEAAEDQRAQRVAGQEGAVAGAADVRRPAPVHALVALFQGDQQVARVSGP